MEEGSKNNRQFRLDLDNVRKVGYKVDVQIFVDLVISMGLSTGAYMCQHITSAVGYIISNMGFNVMLYVDDFNGVEVPRLATVAYKATGQVFISLSLEEKLSQASRLFPRRIVLGVYFDTNTLTMKIDAVRLCCESFSKNQTLHVKSLIQMY